MSQNHGDTTTSDYKFQFEFNLNIETCKFQ